MIEKVCNGPTHEGPTYVSVSEFSKAPTRYRPDGLQAWCKQCMNLWAKIRGYVVRGRSECTLRTTRGKPPNRYNDRADALKAAGFMMEYGRTSLMVTRCIHCEYWHVMPSGIIVGHESLYDLDVRNEILIAVRKR